MCRQHSAPRAALARRRELAALCNGACSAVCGLADHDVSDHDGRLRHVQRRPGGDQRHPEGLNPRHRPEAQRVLPLRDARRDQGTGTAFPSGKKYTFSDTTTSDPLVRPVEGKLRSEQTHFPLLRPVDGRGQALDVDVHEVMVQDLATGQPRVNRQVFEAECD
jgi:hypothetical protein